MKRCSSCNTLCEDYATVCTRCGKRLDARQGGQKGPVQADPYGGQMHPWEERGIYGDRFDHTREFSPEVISKGKPMAMATYLFGIIGLVMGLLSRDSAYVQFHVRQNVKYLVLNWIVAACCLILTGFFVFIGVAVGSFGMLKAGSVFLVLYGIYILVITVLKFICFVWVGQGKAVEALLVRNLGFMR